MMLIHEKWEIKPWQDPSDPCPGSSDESSIFFFLTFSKSLEAQNLFSFAVWQSEITLADSELA